jgi:DNA repair exonuclease SbcCD ATPase subunit
MPPPVFRQGFLNGSNGPRANPHKLISDRKRKVDAFGDKLASIGKVEETVARKVASSLAAVQPTVAKCKELSASLDSAIQRNNELDAEISGILNSPELAAVLSDPHALQAVAGKFDDNIGQQLLSLSSAYLGTEAYTNMAVSHSQKIPDITGPAAAQLAHKLETLGIDHQRAIEEKDEKIAALSRDLATARNEATSNAALAQVHEAALIKQEAETEKLRKNKETSLDQLEQANEDLRRLAEEVETLDSVLGDEILKRSGLSKENDSLATANEGLVQDTRRLQQERDKARMDKEALQNRLAKVELECNSLKAVAVKNAENFRAEVARTNDAMDRLSRTRIESTKAASDLQVRCSALEADNRKLTLDLDVLATRLATADELARSATAEATQLSTRLSESQAEIGALKISCGAKDSRNRELERSIAKEAAEFTVQLSEAVQKGDEKLQEAQQLASTLQSQLEREGQDRVRKLEDAVADLEGSLTQANTNLATEKERATQAAADLVAVQGSLVQANKEIAAEKAHTTRAETELAVVQGSLTRANADIVTEKGRVRSLERDRQGALDALVEYFSASSDASPLWTRFALAAQTLGSCYADGGVPVLWALELWDVDEGHMEPHVQAWDLYAALYNKTWSGCILGSLTRFTATLAHTNKVHVATTQLLLDQAFQALESLDATPAAHICGLAICQLLAVLRRWSALSVPSVQKVADQLPEFAAMLAMDLAVGRKFTPSPSRLDYGQLSLFSQPESLVGFIVDNHLGFIRAVNKTRCTFENGVLVSIRAPDGEDDMVISLDSVSTVNWFLRYWLL